MPLSPSAPLDFSPRIHARDLALGDSLGLAASDAPDAAPESGDASELGDAPELVAPTLCLFTDSLDPSGVGEHMLELARALGDSWRVVFACPRGAQGDPFLERARAAGLQVLVLELDEDGLPLMDALRDWLRLNPGALFHAHAGIGWEGHEAILLARQAGCTIVRTEHLPYLITDEGQVEDHKRLLNSVDLLICVSRAARHSFLEQGLDHAQIKAVCNGLDPRQSSIEPAMARSALLDELKLPRSARLLLTIGRFTQQKGHEYLLRALPILDSGHEYLLWVGQGEDRARLEDLARELGLQDRVLFLGQRADIATLLRAVDVFVLPSLFEGLPLVALEAMAGGLPIVGTRVCGTEEAIGGEEFGWLVPPRDPQALADALAQVLVRPGEAARRAERARQRVLGDFNAARMARETESIYHQALRKRASG